MKRLKSLRKCNINRDVMIKQTRFKNHSKQTNNTPITKQKHKTERQTNIHKGHSSQNHRVYFIRSLKTKTTMVVYTNPYGQYFAFNLVTVQEPFGRPCIKYVNKLSSSSRLLSSNCLTPLQTFVSSANRYMYESIQRDKCSIDNQHVVTLNTQAGMCVVRIHYLTRDRESQLLLYNVIPGVSGRSEIDNLGST